MHLHGQCEMNTHLWSPRNLADILKGISPRTQTTFQFFIVTLCLKYYGLVQLSEFICRQIWFHHHLILLLACAHICSKTLPLNIRLTYCAQDKLAFFVLEGSFCSYEEGNCSAISWFPSYLWINPYMTQYHHNTVMRAIRLLSLHWTK